MALEVKDMTGWDQHTLAPELLADIIVEGNDLEAKAVEKYTAEHPDEERCETCGGIGYGHFESDYGYEIEACGECGKYKYDEDAVEAHRQLCGCRWPEHAPRPYEKDILIEKGMALQDLKCPTCGSEEEFVIESTICVVIKDRKIQKYFDLETAPGQAMRCRKCNHCGRLGDFSASGGA
jgi:hypothetical protein